MPHTPTQDDWLTWMSSTEKAALIRKGDISPRELVDHAIARIERLNPVVNSVIYPRFEEARAQADDVGLLPDGPLRGVPFLIKDIQQTVEGWPYSWGWKLLKDRGVKGEFTGAVLRRFFDAGLITLGQTTVPELGPSSTTETRAWGATRNPWDPSRIVGGSSGGAGASVAAGFVSLAHGNDAGGSIRIPATCNGLVGLKPSRGRSSLGPAYHAIWNHSGEEGVLTRTVRDAAVGLDIIRGPGPGDLYHAPEPQRPYVDEVGADPGRLRVGLLNEALFGHALDREVTSAVDLCARLLEDQGHQVAPGWPSAMADPGLPGQVLMVMGAAQAATVGGFEKRFGITVSEEELAPHVWQLVQLGRATTAEQYLGFDTWRNDVTRRIALWFEESGSDLLLMPALTQPAPRLTGGGSPEGLTAFMPQANFTGLPAMTLPVAVNAAGIPVSAQLMARYGREDVLFRVAAQLEEAVRWDERHPSFDWAQ
ncbi:amidase [Streptomyces sp. NBC_00063]|uniref:amidase n=1 Tax=Streptomyces sp. NBC_00063 TaxID=2975638 RepID=UPI003D72598E